MALIENTQQQKSQRDWDRRQQQQQRREYQFRTVNGKAVTVGLPKPIELAGLAAKHSIKPYTKEKDRKRINSIVAAARDSLRGVK